MSRLGRNFRRGGNPQLSILQRALRVLRKYGSDAHAYIPGVGVLNGLTAGNYTDTAGTQFTTKDQFVGLDLDAMGSLGAELIPPGNWVSGSFAVITSQSDNGFTVDASAGDNFATSYKTVTGLIVGNTYKVTALCNAVVTGAAVFRIGPDVGSATGSLVATSVGTGTVTVSTFFTASATSLQVGVALGLALTKIAASGISVKEVTGIHATQGTAGNKPVLRQGLVCRSYPSGDITLWDTTAAGTITGGQADPVGGTSAQLFSGANKNVYITAGAASGVLSGLSFTHAAHLYSPTGGTLTMGSAAGGAKTTLVTIPAGWSIATAYWTATETNGPVLNLNGSLTSVTVYRQGIYLGTVTASQILAAGGIPLTTSAKASAGTGPSYWEFGGDGTITDYLGLGSVPWTSADDHWVVVAAENSIATTSPVFTVSSTAGASRFPSIYFNVGNVLVLWQDDASVSASTSVAAPNLAPIVISARKVGTVLTARKNGVVFGTQATTGMGTVTLNDVSIGRNLPSGFFFGGNGFCYISGKGAITDADLLLLEKLAANLAGITI